MKNAMMACVVLVALCACSSSKKFSTAGVNWDGINYETFGQKAE